MSVEAGTAMVDMEAGKKLTIEDANKAFEGTKYKATAINPAS